MPEQRTDYDPDASRGSTVNPMSPREHRVASGRPCRVAIAGFGTVGRSVARLLHNLGTAELQVVVICNRDVQRKRVDWLDPSVRWTENIEDALSDDVDVLVELIGGRSPAEEWIRRALAAGKSVVTANKQVIAHAGPELLEAAGRSGRHVRFEAAVAGGVPVVRAIEHGLAGDTLTRVAGILNGTCNYILSRMERDRVPFSGRSRRRRRSGWPKRIRPRTSRASTRRRSWRSSRTWRFARMCRPTPFTRGRST